MNRPASEFIKRMFEKDEMEKAKNIVLTRMEIFSRTEIEVILKQDEEMVDELIDWTSELIADYSKSDIPKIEQLRKIKQMVRTKYPAIFEQAEERKKQIGNYDQWVGNLWRMQRKIKNPISATSSQDEIRKAIEDTVATFSFERLENEIRESIKHEDLVLRLKKDIEEAREALLDYIKLKEETIPVSLYYYRTSNGGVSCKINTHRNGYSYAYGAGRSIRYNKGKDREEYPLIVSAHYIDTFIFQNGIDYKDIIIDPRSIESFYMFDNKVSCNLTSSFINSWWNYDCPDLYRCTVNKDGTGYNMLGERLPHFSTRLVEHTYIATYVDKSITEEEVELLCKGRKNTVIYKEMRSVLKVKTISETDLQQMLEENKAYEKEIQDCIESNRREILDHLASVFEDRIISKEPFKLNENFGLDCGYIYIHTSNPEYNERKRILKKSSLSSQVSTGMDIEFPYDSQSLTLMTVQFDKIREIVKREKGIELYCKTMLD